MATASFGNNGSVILSQVREGNPTVVKGYIRGLPAGKYSLGFNKMGGGQTCGQIAVNEEVSSRERRRCNKLSFNISLVLFLKALPSTEFILEATEDNEIVTFKRLDEKITLYGPDSLEGLTAAVLSKIPENDVSEEKLFCGRIFPDVNVKKAVAVLTSDQGVSGEIHFEQNGPKSPVKISSYGLEGLSQGFHGFHIHAVGDTGNGCKAAGGHFNPHQVPTIGLSILEALVTNPNVSF